MMRTFISLKIWTEGAFVTQLFNNARIAVWRVVSWAIFFIFCFCQNFFFFWFFGIPSDRSWDFTWSGPRPLFSSSILIHYWVTASSLNKTVKIWEWTGPYGSSSVCVKRYKILCLFRGVIFNGTAVSRGWFSSHTCKNHNKWYAESPKLLCSCYCITKFYNVVASRVEQPVRPRVGHLWFN